MEECKALHERADANTRLVPGEAQDSSDLEGEPERGEEHAQVVVPFGGLNRGQRGVETTDYAGVVFRHGPLVVV